MDSKCSTSKKRASVRQLKTSDQTEARKSLGDRSESEISIEKAADW
jgi:hypothetical protein